MVTAHWLTGRILLSCRLFSGIWLKNSLRQNPKQCFWIIIGSEYNAEQDSKLVKVYLIGEMTADGMIMTVE